MSSELDKDIREAQEALQDWKSPGLSDEVLICECYCVSVLDIRQTLSNNSQINLELLREKYGLGSGCGRCVKELNDWKNLIFR
jgi:bacterioferritin-associated ferredoxin